MSLGGLRISPYYAVRGRKRKSDWPKRPRSPSLARSEYDKGWQMPVRGMYQRRYDRDVYGTVLYEGPSRWRWMVYIDNGPEIASGVSFSPTSIEARRATNEAWWRFKGGRTG